MSILGINDEKGIPKPKLEHIFLGTVKTINRGIDIETKTSGYHCDKSLGDEKVYAEVHMYSKSRRKITVNGRQKIFEAIVRAKGTKTLKNENGGKSTFYNEKWSRQDVVCCISRIKTSAKIVKEYGLLSDRKKDDPDRRRLKQVCIDRKTGLVVVNASATTYPLIRL